MIAKIAPQNNNFSNAIGEPGGVNPRIPAAERPSADAVRLTKNVSWLPDVWFALFNRVLSDFLS